MAAGDILLPTCAGACTCSSVCVNLTSTFPAFPSGPLTFTTTSTGPVTPPTCLPVISIVSLFDNAHGGFPSVPILQLAQSGGAGFNFNWTLNITYNGTNIMSDSGNFTTPGSSPFRMPLNASLWSTDPSPTGFFYHQWYFSNSSVTPVASASVVVTFTMDNNPAGEVHFYNFSWFEIIFWTS